jgi:hypothetical protein
LREVLVTVLAEFQQGTSTSKEEPVRLYRVWLERPVGRPRRRLLFREGVPQAEAEALAAQLNGHEPPTGWTAVVRPAGGE